MIRELNERAREVLRLVVDTYVETGEPVGSRSISRRLRLALSPASIRNVMADLEEAGLLFAPHTSAGRLPTEAGLRFFVDGLLQVGEVNEEERREIESRCLVAGRSVTEALTQATEALSGLTRCAGLVFAPKREAPLRHIEFVSLAPGRALAILVTEDGMVENRVVEVPAGLPPSTLVQASNFLNARLQGRTVAEARDEILGEIEKQRGELDGLAAKVIADGLAVWAGGEARRNLLILKGQAKLLDDAATLADLERVRQLIDTLETRGEFLRLLEGAEQAEGVQVYIGSENRYFDMAGCSMIVAPYVNLRRQVVGAIGVIGPTRLNYARIVPMVDYTAKLVGRMLG
ncbi:MAG: heat-inducible transcriptional repressor HrcA [Alphaproteobacteria bacterium]|nr:heat-inducible transcriptional repressor HrcA [Alphaproteobacteria bacterium]